ncbi:hypothetical protein [Vibrio penaeicida]|uniref:hypothetical protein n=1 Tax=Vibrio penaeicida TaxID=104609 RepID=UPI001CC6DB4F|nr:hypothetical protein [Vibrio penaeicida]
MAKTDWAQLQTQFERENRENGVGAREWCEQHGLNYHSARRYIKVRKSAPCKSAQTGRQSAQRKRVSGQFQTGNQRARKSGIYARYYPEEKRYMFDLARSATLVDELMMTRVRLQSGFEYLALLISELGLCDDQERRMSLHERVQRAGQDLNALTARVESLEKPYPLSMPIALKLRKPEAARKLRLESDKLAQEEEGDGTPLDEMLTELQAMGTGGLPS